MNFSLSSSSIGVDANSEAPPLVGLPGYQPSGLVGPLSVPLFFVTALVAPRLVAFLYDKTAHFGTGIFSSMWMVLLGAALLGAAVGGTFFPAIHFGKARNNNLAAIVGCLAGLTTFALALGIEAEHHRSEVMRYRAKTALTQGSLASSGLSRVELTRQYLELRAQEGLEVTGRRGRGSNINGGMFWGLLGIEALLAAIAATLVPYYIAGRRFSEERNRWFLFKTVDSVLPQDAPALVQAAQERDWERFVQIAKASKDPKFKEYKPAITVYYVPEKAGGILLIRAIADPKKPVATVYESELSNEELKIIWPGFPAPTGV